MTGGPDPGREVLDPATTAQRLAQIAAERPDLGAAVVRHPQVYDGLLDWLAAYGDAAARQAVHERRRGQPPSTVDDTVVAMPSAFGPSATGLAASAPVVDPAVSLPEGWGAARTPKSQPSSTVRRGWLANHRVAAVVAAIVTVVIVGGGVAVAVVASQGRAPVAASTPTPTPTPVPTRTPTPSPSPTVVLPDRIELDTWGDVYRVRNGVLVTEDGGDVRIFDPRLATGAYATAEPNGWAPGPVAPGTGTEITRSGYVIVGREDDLRVVFVYQLRTKADGLTPESFENRVSVVDPFEGEVVLDAPLPASEAADATSAYSFIDVGDIIVGDAPVLFINYGSTGGDSDQAHVDAVSTETGALLWHALGWPDVSAGPNVIVDDGRCDDMFIVDSLTGAVVSQLPELREADGWRYCAYAARTASGQYWIYYGSDGNASRGSLLVDAATGATLADYPHGRTVLTDPVAPYVFVLNDANGGDGTAQVWNLETGEVVLELAADVASRLDFDLTTVFDGHLYFSNTDEAPVIDLATGEKVTANAVVVPQRMVGDDWVLLAGDGGDVLVRREPGAWYSY